jgi:Zn-finger nucleic acid-binding protein
MESLEELLQAVRDEHTLACPQCKKELYVVYHEDVEIDTCQICHGAWVEHVKESQILSKRPAGLSVDELNRLRKFYRPFGKLDPVRYLPCPVCNQLMSRKNWGSYSGVIVDCCEGHGTWYDHKELDKIKEFVRLGGMEYEKLKHTDKDIQRLNTRLYHEVERLDKKILHARLMNLFFNA